MAPSAPTPVGAPARAFFATRSLTFIDVRREEFFAFFPGDAAAPTPLAAAAEASPPRSRPAWVKRS
eukprot:23359-Pelagococcus_subviridis.AAC.1